MLSPSIPSNTVLEPAGRNRKKNRTRKLCRRQIPMNRSARHAAAIHELLGAAGVVRRASSATGAACPRMTQRVPGRCLSCAHSRALPRIRVPIRRQSAKRRTPCFAALRCAAPEPPLRRCNAPLNFASGRRSNGCRSRISEKRSASAPKGAGVRSAKGKVRSGRGAPSPSLPLKRADARAHWEDQPSALVDN